MLRRLTWLVLILAVAAVVAAGASLRSYRALTKLELVAVVEYAPAPPGSACPFALKVKQVRAGEFGQEELFPMRGDQWTVSGDFLKWAPWLSMAGVPPLHKLTRLSSRYLLTAEEVNAPRTAYDLNGGSSPVWRWLRRFGPSFPLVEAVYGSAVYTEARRGGRWGVYVTHSGYLINFE